MFHSSILHRYSLISHEHVISPQSAPLLHTSRRRVACRCSPIDFVPEQPRVLNPRLHDSLYRLFEVPKVERCVDTCDPKTFLTTSGRIIAIGDLHGDMEKTIECLKIAGVMTLDGSQPVWTGGNTIVVQMGDVMDRGDYEIAIVMLLRELDRQAKMDNGAVYMLNGNHESLNVALNFRYVTMGAWIESAAVAGLNHDTEPWDDIVRARAALYRPGGDMALELSKNPTVLVINDTVFAHGGLLPIHVKHGIDRINSEVAAWMRGDKLEDGSFAPPPFMAMGDNNSIMWHRSMGIEKFKTPVDRFYMCKTVEQSLAMLGAKRLVVGHTPQLCGANCECEGALWRVDVGMSAGVRGLAAQVLEIRTNPDGNSLLTILPAPEEQVCVVPSQMCEPDGSLPGADKPETPRGFDIFNFM